MSVLKRLTDILSANVNELIERYEDPEPLLKQAVREMEQSIRAALEDAAKVVAHEKILARQLAQEESAIETWRLRATNSAARGDDAQALEFLRQKREQEIVAAALTKQLAEVTDAAQLLRRQIETMRRRVAEAKRKLVLLAARQRAAEARLRLVRECTEVAFRDDPFHKFDRMCCKVAQSEADADAWTELTRESIPCLVSIEHDSRVVNEELEAELREIKAKCGS